MRKYSYAMLHIAHQVPVVKGLQFNKVIDDKTHPGMKMEEHGESIDFTHQGKTFEIPKVNFHILIVEDELKNESNVIPMRKDKKVA